MALYDRSYTTFYWSAIVNIVLSDIVFELFDVEWYRDLEIWVRCHSRSFTMVPFESLGAVSYSPSIVAMALSCISSEKSKKSNILVESRDFFVALLCSTRQPVRGSPSEYCHSVSYGKTKLEWWGYPMVKKNFEGMCNRLDTITACDGRIDRRTDGRRDRHTSCHGIVRAMHI